MTVAALTAIMLSTTACAGGGPSALPLSEKIVLTLSPAGELQPGAMPTLTATETGYSGNFTADFSACNPNLRFRLTQYAAITVDSASTETTSGTWTPYYAQPFTGTGITPCKIIVTNQSGQTATMTLQLAQLTPELVF
jgi:hypothetical protein